MLQVVKISAVSLLLSIGSTLLLAEEATLEQGSSAASMATESVLKESLDELRGKVDGLEESYLETKGSVEKMAKLKVSGYIQAQFQRADTMGVTTSKAGSKFDKGSDSRFLVRRSRLKFQYKNGLSNAVVQFDASTGGLEIKDAYVSFTEPWIKMLTTTAGIFDRPFGFEIGYSSSMRESPERAYIIQALFPKEKDIGAQIGFATENGPLQYFNAKAGIFNGLTSLQLENDKNKDAIGRIGFELPLAQYGMAIDGGFSAYRSIGGVVNTDADTVTGGASYSMNGKLFSKKTGQKGHEFERQYLGFDVQYYLDVPVLGGLTLRTEYISGVQPGTASSSSFYQPSAGGINNGPVFSRNFSGMYLYWAQCIGSRVQSVVKYDWYDPNSDIDGDAIGAKDSYTSKTDIAWNTLGFGVIYHWDSNVKLMLYYDMPTNEKSANLSGYAKDITDNVITIRAQYKF